jgi:PAS domain S-box-containing protein
MHAKAPHPGSNGILAALAPDQRQRVLEDATLVTLEPARVISDAEQPIEFVYFPTTCVLSVLSMTTAKVAVETGVVGYEGMAPITAFHQLDRAAEQVIVQVPGEALRMTRAAFDAAVASVPALRVRMHHYSQALFTFAAQSSACNRQHSVVQRCARWLLTTHDRVPGDDFFLTHLFLSQMLGVRRSSITIAMEVLRAAGAIAYTRGRVQVVDREVLRERACECYAIIRSVYDRVLAGVQTPSPLSSVAMSEGGTSTVGGGTLLERRSSQAQTGAVPPAASLEEFREHLRSAERRRDSLRDAVTHGGLEREQALQLLEELSGSLEQLQVAEEEMRVQMEALDEIRSALETQQQVWRARFDGLPDAYIETNRDDTIVEVNHAAEELLGRARETMIGKPMTTLFPEADRRELRGVIGQLRNGARTAHWSGMLVGGKSTKPVVPVAVAAAPVSVAPAAAPSLSHTQAVTYHGARWLLRPTAQYKARAGVL